MERADSIIDAEDLARVRALLTPRPRRERVWPVLAAAAFAAASALAFATAMIMAPPLVSQHVAESAPQ
jgi:hypothetical protein